MAGITLNGKKPKTTKTKKSSGLAGLHIDNVNTKNTLEYDGVKFGTVTNAGLKAIENNTLDSYTPATEEEKRAIRSYKAYKSYHETKKEEERSKAEEENKNGASALLDARNKFTSDISLTAPTIASSPKKETKAEATEDEYYVRNYTKEPIKVKVGSGLPDLSTMHNTAFGDVKVDVTPKNSLVKLYDVLNKREAEEKEINTVKELAEKYGYTVNEGSFVHNTTLSADARSEEMKKDAEVRLKDWGDYPEKSEVLAYKYDFNLTDLNSDKFKEIVSKNNITEDSEEYKLLEDIKWVNFGKENPKIYQAIKVAGDIGSAVETLGSGIVSGVESTGQFLASGGHWLLGTAMEFGSDVIGAFAPAVFVDDASPVTNAIDDTAKMIKNEGEKILEKKYLGEQWSDNINERYRNVTHDAVKNTLLPVIQSGGTLIPAIATEILTASASPMGDIWVAKTFSNLAKGKATVKAVSKGDIVFGLSAAGSASSQAVREGANLDSALMYGTFNGVGEVVTEKIFGGFAGTNIGKSIINFKTSNKFFNTALDLGGEAFEEIIMTFADPYFRRATFDANAEIPSLSDYTESAKQGILLSLLMKVSMFPFSVKSSKQRKEAVQVLNSCANGLNEIIIDENQKLGLLPKNATVEDIKAKQKEIAEYSKLYAQQLSGEVANNLTENSGAIDKKYEEIKGELQSEAKEVYNGIAEAMGVDAQTPNEVPTSANRSDVDTTPAVTTPTETQATPTNAVETTPTSKGVTSESLKQTTPTVNIGDTFKVNNGTRSVLKVVGRDDKFTTVEVTYESGNKQTMNFTNEYADSMKTNPKFSKIDNSSVSNTKVDNVVTNETEHSPAIEENVPENSPVANTNVADNDSSETYIRKEDGRLRFNQKDIDYADTTVRRGEFRVKSKDKAYETVNGYLNGDYGIFKNGLTNTYDLMLLKSGMSIASFKTLSEAQKASEYLNKNTSISDVVFAPLLSGGLSIVQTEELKAYASDIKRILENKEYESANNTPAEIQDGKVPFRTKAELVEYVKVHKGDNIKVSFDNGVSEVRTLEGASNTNLRTKKSDGSVVSAELKGVKFNDTGFSVDYSTGVSVMYDFVNVSDNNSSEVLNKQSESDIIVENTENGQGEVKTNGSIEEYDGSGETQLRETDKNGVHSQGSDTTITEDKSNSERGNERIGRSNSEKQTEIRQGLISDVFHGTPYSFANHEKSYVDLGIHFGTEEQARARLDKGQGNILQRNLKLENPLVTKDIFGERTPEEYVTELVQKSELSNSEKEVLRTAFDNFLKTDIEREARTSLIEKLFSGNYQIKTKVSQEGVLVSLAIVDDTSNTNEIPLTELIDKNELVDILGFEETAKILKTEQLSDTANKSLNEYLSEVVLPFEIQYLKLREIENILKSFGYDGFAYQNENEGTGWSYAVFDNEQILTPEAPAQNAKNKPKSNETKSGKEETPAETKNVATEPNLSDTEVKENANDEQRHEVLDGESGNDDAGLQSESRNADEEEGIERVSGDSGQTSGEVLPTDTVNRGRNKSDVGNDGEGTSRTDDNGNVGQEGERTDRGRSGLSRYGDVGRGTDRGNGVVPVTGELTTESETPEVIETVDKAVDKSRPSNKENFIITNDVAEELDNNYPSAKDNIEAIELLLKIESEGRPATADEKKILAKYKGWGGIDTRRIEWELQRRLNDLYDYEQRRSMQDSGTNAFFTPTKVIDAMYNGLKRMGFKGGNVLETSMGIGNFFGRMPSNLVAKSALTGVELEAYTARIAQLLYPGATVINKPFQDVVIKNGSYDLVIGNVPFGNEKLSYNGKKYSLHNYFIISSLDKVRDGGIVAVITSAGTLDNYSIDARSAIMDRADVVACYKLPAGVFSRNAKTDVQSDLLILRKRANGAKPVGDSILNVTEKDGLRLNEYFVKHPENILGTLSKGTNAWGEITTVLNNGKFDEMLTDAMAKLPKNIMNGEVELKPVNTIVTTESKPRFFEKDGKVYEDNGAGEAVEVTRNVETVRDYIAVREAYKTMLDAYNQDLSEAEIKPLRETLIKAYDNFYAKHTAISGDGKKKIGNKKCENNLFLEADSDYYLLCGLERHNKKEGKFEKSAVFEKDTLRKKKVTSVDTSSEALAVSLNETGSIDFKMMSELTGKTEKELAEELKGEIVYTPQGKYELLDIYLSGDIYAKLEEVKGKPEFKEQEEMLKTVLPTPKDASQITVKLGANYIDESYIEDFANDVFNQYITVKKNSSGNWTIVGAEQSRYGELVNSKYGCKSLNAIQLLQRILNDADIVCNKTVQQGDKKISVFDKEMTDIALGKADDIRSAFENWIFRDSNRRNTIVDKYNRMYNAVKPLDYEHIASKLTFNSMNPTLRNRLYPHQKKGIARFLFGGNTLFAHGVGTGKTFEMIASVMEAKQMGIVNKTAMVVPNNKVVDFKKDILEAYPNAKVLVIDTANKKRQTMLGLVNSNDWDIILVARTTFTKIPVSAEMQKNFYNSQLEALEREIAEAQTDRNISKRQINSLINQRKTLEEKLKDLDKATDRDEGVDFDKLGIDCICVDEAHNYKSVTTPSKLQIKGLVNKNNAQQANDMLMKLDYLRSIDGKIIFGTGTPITNTVSEIYNMTRMVRPDILENAGIHSLDEWVNTFAKVESNFEIDIDGTIKSKPTKSIRSFVNSTELVAMFRQFADIVFTQDVVKDLPKAIHHSIELEGTKEHKLINKMVNTALTSARGTEKLAVYGSMSGMLSASAVDLRMLSGVEKDGNPLADYSLEELDYENSKVNTMCGYIMKHYKDSRDIKGTQIVFCDGGAGSGKTYTFNVHKDIKAKLVKLGIPENEIVIIKDQNDSKLDELYAQVNSGEVRVLIGTSAKMAEGLNVQERVVAIHHPTVSYKPSDLEQGDARGVRKGNMNSEVHIYRYLQGDTADSHKWQAIDRKGEMIRNALKGEDVGELEDIGADDEGGADIDPATAMAITSGNPLIKAKIDIDKKVNTLLTIKKNYQSEIYNYQDIIAKNPTHIATLERQIAKIKEDIALRDKYGDNTKMVIKGKEYQKQGEANKALLEAVKTTAKNGTYIKIGEYNGFDVLFKGETGGLGYALMLKGAYEYSVDYNAQGNTMARFAGVLSRLDRDVENRQNQIDRMTKDLETAKQEVNKPFEREKELNEALVEQKQITYDYEHYDEVKAKYEGAQSTEDTDDDVSDDNSYDQVSANDRWKTENVEHNKTKKTDVSLGRIVKKIRTKFGVPISTGKVPHKDARGVYKRKAETIRTRIANNLPTIAHELGHHLDKMYSLSGNKSVESLMKALPQDFLSLYPTKEQGKEAVAEFVRTYLKSTTEAQKLSAEFYNDFVMTLSKEDLKALNEIASDFNYYLSMEIEEKFKSAIVNSKPTLKEKAKDIREGGIEGVKASVEDKAHDSYTKWIDAFDPIKQAVDFVEKSTEKNLDGTHSAYVLATNSLNATTIASYLVNDGFRDLKGNILEEMSFKECIKGVKAKDLNTLSEYLVLKHSLELIEQDMRVFADDTLEDVDTINANIAKIEREHPEMIEASENLYQYQKNMLKYYLVDSGLLSVEGFNAMVEKYPCYVPFYRDVSSKKQGRARGTFANQSTPINRIKGSGASIINPLESIVMNTEKFVKSATRNQVMQVLTSYANEAEGFGQFIEKVTPDMLPHLIDITKYKEQFTERLQQTVNAVDYFNVTNLLDEVINDTVMDFTPKANASKKLVTVMRNGKASYYQIHDNALYSAIAEMTVPQLEGDLKMISKIMLPMKMLMTQINPLFASSNFFRDYGTAYKHSQINNPVTFAVRYMGALKSIINNDEMYQQYKAMGGGHSSKLATDINLIKKSLRDIEVKDKGKARQMAYAIFRHPLETITALNDIVESVPRVLEFTKTLIETGDYQQAIFNADDITTNFKRHGSGATAKAVNQFVFFNNASLQGLDKTRRSLTGKDAVSKWTKWALFALLSSALQYFWNRREDEEGYEQLSSYTKNNFYNYAIGDGKFVAIPKPRETAILDSFTERTIEYVFGNKEAFYDFGGYLADNLLPPMVAEDLFVGDIEGAVHDFFGGMVVGGITDIGFNKDFMGRPIESNYEQDYLESWERYDEGTSKLAYHLGQTEWARNNDMSPKKIDHLLASSLGIIGSAIQAVFPMDETRKDVTLGLRNRFIKDSVYSTDVINKLWENTEKAEAQFKFDSTIDNAIEYEQNAIITNFVSQMNNAIYSLPVEEQREARKLLLKELNRWDYELTTSQQQMKTSLADREIDGGIIIDKLPSSKLEWTEDGEKYYYQMTPEEYVKYVKDVLNEIEQERIYCKEDYPIRDDYLDELPSAISDAKKEIKADYKDLYYSKRIKE